MSRLSIFELAKSKLEPYCDNKEFRAKLSYKEIIALVDAGYELQPWSAGCEAFARANLKNCKNGELMTFWKMLAIKPKIEIKITKKKPKKTKKK